MELSEDQFLDRFLMFIEENRWSFGGGVRTIIDGCYINADGTPGKPVWPEEDKVPAIKTFSQSIVKWLEEHGEEENRVIQQYGLSFPKIRRFADELGHVCDVAMEHGYGLAGVGD